MPLQSFPKFFETFSAFAEADGTRGKRGEIHQRKTYPRFAFLTGGGRSDHIERFHRLLRNNRKALVAVWQPFHLTRNDGARVAVGDNFAFLRIVRIRVAVGNNFILFGINLFILFGINLFILFGNLFVLFGNLFILFGNLCFRILHVIKNGVGRGDSFPVTGCVSHGRRKQKHRRNDRQNRQQHSELVVIHYLH